MSSSYFHHFDCEVLPAPQTSLVHGALLKFGLIRNDAFYLAALGLAHKLLKEGRAGRSLLLLDRAMSVKLKDPLRPWPVPYAAVAFILNAATAKEIGGNPRVHYEHLATRLEGEANKLRVWRAWACWWMVRKLRPDFPADPKQLVPEPLPAQIAEGLRRQGSEDELRLWQKVVDGIEEAAGSQVL
ncbi:MAG: hypothetical protein SGI98_06225 [Verrucomicrobiota bacterium]|nr:hypothetical protein [Verrucomicrobiota bacterium]